MRTVRLAHPADFDGWRNHARELAVQRVPADQVVWRVRDDPDDLFGDAPVAPGNSLERPFSVSRKFLEMAQGVIPHVDPERFALLYAALMRQFERRSVIEDTADPLMFRLWAMRKGVQMEVHKMRAFVRFRSVGTGPEERFAAWFEPHHHIIRPNSGFFRRRFAQMQWSILTPQECVHWDMKELRFAPGVTLDEVEPGEDPLEATWLTYYANIFNPARVKVGAMLREMPKRYWRNMPETALVPELIAGAQKREQGMIEASAGRVAKEAAAGVDPACFDEDGTARAPHPAEPLKFAPGEAAAALAEVAELARGCTRCPLYKPATQTVFGEGPPDARLMFLGEQPGDQEDLAGHPFVGPAGQLFDRALAEAGVDRSAAYVTNAVKHFKFEQRGKRRIHAKPDTSEIDACRWWIEQERKIVQPRLTVAMGVTAARSLTGRNVTISRERGRPHVLADGSEYWIIVHPSFLLRVEDKEIAALEYERFVGDLRTIWERLAALG